MTLMTAADAMSLDQSYQEPGLMRDVGSASAFSFPHQPKRPWRAFAVRGLQTDDDSSGLEAPSSLTELVVRLVEPRRAVSAELTAKARAAKVVHQAYYARIEALKTDAALDGFSLNRASERDFWSFIRSSPFIKKGRLVLMDNGNLRAAWKDDEGNHLGLQFLGNRSIQYVIFRRRPAGRVSRVAGCDTQKGIERQIQAFDLNSLLYA